MPAEVRAVLLDIEGTTTPVDFVYQTLFPFARRHLREFLIRKGETADLRADIALLEEEHERDRLSTDGPPSWTEETVESVIGYALWLMDRDRKSTGLKSIQGKIWEEGYKSGELLGVVYDDVPIAFRRWKEQGREIAIYSSGSVLAQKLIFAHTNAGDLMPFIDEYFDTTTGPKKESASYDKIAAALGIAVTEVKFYSDSLTEVDAAGAAGMQTALCVREGELSEARGHRVIRDFCEE
jgi:enolase-phosphatase E1